MRKTREWASRGYPPRNENVVEIDGGGFGELKLREFEVRLNSNVFVKINERSSAISV